ncbi:AsmA-like C-terminal region-containing protein [Candidatus Pelagibacter sp.]|nr:AsmA-like C-terminal region-containing protein [Candidatus Pelagibacter sp.]
MKIFLKFFITLLLLIFITLSYLSIFGIETDKFNNQITEKIQKFDKNLEVELKKIKLILDPFQLKLQIKTIGTNLINQSKKIEIENIKTQLSLKSLIEDKFLIENLEISSKSLEIKNLISFLRSFQNTPELFIMEKAVKKGYLITDIKLEFDSNGNIKSNYKINGIVKDVELNVLKKYNLQKLDFIFDYNRNNFLIKDLDFKFDKIGFSSEKVSIKKNNNDFFVDGTFAHKKSDLDKRNIDLLVKPFLPNFEIEKISLTSNNDFSFEIQKGFKFENFKINSEILVHELIIPNNLKLKRFFPKQKKMISLLDQKIKLQYEKNNFTIKGNGNLLYQVDNDDIDYFFSNKNKTKNFEITLRIKDNPFNFDYLNYKKKKKNEIFLNFKGSQNKNNELVINSLNLNEDKNFIKIKNLVFNEKLQISKLDEVDLDYLDQNRQKNSIRLKKDKKKYYLTGSSFNAENFIEELLSKNDEGPKIIDINTNLEIDIEKIFLDSEYYLTDFKGDISIKNNEIQKANLIGSFSKNKKLKFTINSIDNNKITTLFVDEAKPFVKRYKFIKGFDEGSLDFYNSKKSKKSVSQIKIYDFKLKELPILTKILTLASLQGIADILSGEGIRFTEFEMNFKNEGNLMTIDEIYAIGPAISILMEGYVEKNKLISLKGTLVPATTINNFIGSLPVLGEILVGKKTGEGVFGVSFKIKGPPKNLKTSVNPVKTLTPRFITRTLEKIKKN